MKNDAVILLVILVIVIFGGTGIYYSLIKDEAEPVAETKSVSPKSTQELVNEQEKNFLCIHPLNIQTNLPYNIYSYQKSVLGGYSITGERDLFLFDINELNPIPDQLSNLLNDDTTYPVKTDRVDIEVFSVPVGFIVIGERSFFFLNENENESLDELILDLIGSFSYSSCENMPPPRTVDLRFSTDLAFEDWASSLSPELKELYEVMREMKKDTYLNPSKTNEEFFERSACYNDLLRNKLSFESGPVMIVDSSDSRKSYPVEDKFNFIKSQIQKLVEKELNTVLKNLDGKGVFWPPEPYEVKNLITPGCKNLNIPDKYK